MHTIDKVSLMIEHGSSQKHPLFQVITKREQISLVLYVSEDLELTQNSNSFIHFAFKVFSYQSLVISFR